MGLLVEGKWVDQWYDTESTGGKFVRKDAAFRNWVTADGSAGPTGQAGFKAEPGRYHLYISLACPWACRTLIFRKLKGLENMISLSIVNPHMGEHGWTFDAGEGVIDDPIFSARYLYEVYTHVDPQYTGRVTVPVLYDKVTDTIVSNESSEIIRMMNSAFDGIGAKEGDYYPQELRDDIDELNDMIYNTINNGVYKAGFATDQKVYEEEVKKLFQSFNELEQRLESRRYLFGDTLTEADWRLFTTLIRFEPVYFGHFKCNLRALTSYPNLWRYTKTLYHYPGIAETVSFNHIKTHYYTSHDTINPNRIVPLGPDMEALLKM
ncbi:glutathione S-transferase family protein [Peptoniphilus equinus]|uniref:Glutathione S-transferase family protein n=1 Tax=Peptoniphilus equinus TaxID=3016343 RepID=A0ABY7QXG7_9FIRM|nr:glutathione S-transferase family protein [Peptoniphilus equinus]WBW50638.1 glutathione S-transferase family protein [Peptoniphilus equinus]